MQPRRLAQNMIIVELGFSQKCATSPDSMVDLMFPINMMNMVIFYGDLKKYNTV